jgi:phosphatidate cytidylyltransferase
MSDLPRRTLTGLIYAAVVLLAVRGPYELFLGLVAVLAGLALAELARLRRAGLAAALELIVIVTGAASLVYLRVVNAPRPIGCGPDCMWGPLLMTIVAVWAADVTAYVVGSVVGRRKIAPRISPGKTWEGTVAGFLAAAAVVVLWSRPELGLPTVSLVIAILVGPAAFAGDLLESWVKRRAGVKDSGTLLPGHGGVLDRIDSLLAAAPAVAVTIAAAGRMG